MKKPTANIKIDVTDNGCLVTVTMKKKVVGSKVFLNEQYSEQKGWIDKVIQEEIEKNKVQNEQKPA